MSIDMEKKEAPDSAEQIKEHLAAVKEHIKWMKNNKEMFINKLEADGIIASAKKWSQGGKKQKITKEIFASAIDKCRCGIHLSIRKNEYLYDMFFDTQPDFLQGIAWKYF